MSVATTTTTQVLQKQQSKLPTSMRYERVQDILEKDSALGPMLSQKSQSIDSRFGEKIHFSKEAIAVTEAIHAEGKDAHKVPKNEVLRVAMRVMKFMPGNGDIRSLVPPAAASVTADVAPTAPPSTAKKKAAAKPKTGESPKASTAKPKKKPETKPQSEQPKPEKASKPQKTTKAKPEPPKVTPTPEPAAATAEEAVPESELPPEKQPLRLPAAFDSTKWPHYDVQNSVYCLLLSALNLSEHFEKFPGFEDRQRKLELLLKDYLATCDAIKIAS